LLVKNRRSPHLFSCLLPIHVSSVLEQDSMQGFLMFSWLYKSRFTACMSSSCLFHLSFSFHFCFSSLSSISSCPFPLFPSPPSHYFFLERGFLCICQISLQHMALLLGSQVCTSSTSVKFFPVFFCCHWALVYCYEEVLTLHGNCLQCLFVVL
jgi:hypothetical protein